MGLTEDIAANVSDDQERKSQTLSHLPSRVGADAGYLDLRAPQMDGKTAGKRGAFSRSQIHIQHAAQGGSGRHLRLRCYAFTFSTTSVTSSSCG